MKLIFVSDRHVTVHVFGESRVDSSDTTGGRQVEPAAHGKHCTTSLNNFVGFKFALNTAE
jgi:hypothetical protein